MGGTHLPGVRGQQQEEEAGREGGGRWQPVMETTPPTAVDQSTYRTDVFMAAVIAEIGSRDAARQEAHTAAAQPWMVGSTRKTKVILGPKEGRISFYSFDEHSRGIA